MKNAKETETYQLNSIKPPLGGLGVKTRESEEIES